MSSLLVAAVQLRSTSDRLDTQRRSLALIERAAGEGARFIATPENTDVIGPRREKIAGAETLEGPLVSSYRDAAARLGVWLLLGSFAEQVPGNAQKVHNTSVLIDPDGAIAHTYRKIHLFDASLPDGVPYCESEVVVPGASVEVADTSFAKLGLSVCYDLRFPELYRKQSAAGATMLCVPSAFTVPTGRAHWETLLRARAIENLSWVVAPAQVGRHGEDRASWGHSLIIDPWGKIVADAGGENEGLAFAKVDTSAVGRARAMVPALDHRRLS